MTFDSLGASHKKVGSVLRHWLAYEARDKLKGQHVYVNPIQYRAAKVNFRPTRCWI